MQNTVKRSLWLTMSIMVGFVMAVGVVGYLTLSREVETIRLVITEDLAFFNLSNQLKIEFLQLRRYEKDYFLNLGSPEKQADYLQKYQDIAAALPHHIKRLSEMAQIDLHLSAEIKGKAAALAENFHDYLEGFHQVQQQAQADGRMTPQQANALMTAHKGSIPLMEQEALLLDQAGEKMLAEVAAAAITRGQEAKVFIVLVIVIATAAAGLLGAFLSRAIYRAIFKEGFRRLAGRI